MWKINYFGERIKCGAFEAIQGKREDKQEHDDDDDALIDF